MPLSIEKALKGPYVEKFSKDPPKIHDLVYFVKKIELTLPEEHEDFLNILNELSVPTRYPDELSKLLKEYKKNIKRKKPRNCWSKQGNYYYG